MPDNEIITNDTVSIPSNISPKLENGKLNTFGMDISISEIIGEKIVDTYLSSITPDDMDLILKAIEEELFDHTKPDDVKFFKKTTTQRSTWGYSTETVDTPLWKITKNIFANKYNDLILNKVNEILATDEYQEKANKIANEIVDYATEGYKNDMIKRIRERLVDNVIEPYPHYKNESLKSIIYDTVREMVPEDINLMHPLQ